jgi:hypothetical protein
MELLLANDGVWKFVAEQFWQLSNIRRDPALIGTTEFICLFYATP